MDGFPYKFVVPCLLGDVRKVYGTDVLLLRKNTPDTVHLSDSYELQANEEYILAHGPPQFGYSHPSALNILTLSQLQQLLNRTAATLFPVQGLKKDMDTAISGLDKLDNKRYEVNRNALDLAISSLRRCRQDIPDKDPDLDLVDFILLPLMRLQRNLEQPAMKSELERILLS